MPRARKISRRVVCENRFFDVVFDTIEMPSGFIVEDFLVIRPKVAVADNVNGVLVLPEVDGKIGLMLSYRHQLDREVWQAPGGFIDPDETPEQAALRELGEETSLSCQPENLESLGIILTEAGLIEGRSALFVARRCTRTRAHSTDEHEMGAAPLKFYDPATLATLLRTTEA